MLVRFLRDFQSMHTGERFYPRGATADLDSGAAHALIAEGAVEAVPLTAREGQAKPKEEAPARRERKARHAN
jgi:hypothetical protein